MTTKPLSIDKKYFQDMELKALKDHKHNFMYSGLVHCVAMKNCMWQIRAANNFFAWKDKNECKSTGAERDTVKTRV